MINDYNLYHYKELSSTNLEAIQMAKKGALDGTVILADMQSSGRGRHGKDWISPKGNLYASIIIRDKANVNQLTHFTFITTVAVGNILLALSANLDLKYKWPNDILINNKKIAGILLETEANASWLVIGIGINILFAPEYAVSLSQICNLNISSLTLLKELISNFDKVRQRWLSEGFLSIRKMWLERAYMVGSLINIRMGNRLHSGTFSDIDQDGKIVISTHDNNLISLESGEVFY
ncbi:MAG: biotin--[acetyl-CoA-carboxylase] ligase [Candidatus Mesenet longicola]|uniref:Biotin--[acetyl-CoA-carboxylase] ligase n=1 Tax=Candidatus Mesenet longicola TaxID=1892558 RepID=A0A8J3HQN8_9RICK|nr:MAG: biotin--[acetyl-CoA-carboxylase] ligase [Candidatus Mesenet longicola]GHM59848.1 MAG: biotin--[acetyl-CoA-carboxylase] ligase [Candidatus Mesenet longicola]